MMQPGKPKLKQALRVVVAVELSLQVIFRVMLPPALEAKAWVAVAPVAVPELLVNVQS
jgi:hypothetical protein